MRRTAPELILSALAVAAITAWYIGRVRVSGVPPASGRVGHGMGIIGFLMMLSTETLYTIRKRSTRLPGPTRTWLQAHIFTGIVGSYLVVLHSGWKFKGLAGVLVLLTLAVVASGFVGRYIYTAVPRRLDGVELAVSELEEQIAQADRRLEALGIDRLEKQAWAGGSEVSEQGWVLVLARPFLRWRQRRRRHQAVAAAGAIGKQHAAQLEQLLAERYRFQMQIQSLAVARRLMALWHLIHVPLGAVLFTLAFIHIGAALYYATFLR
jgi:hypothetical protein